MKVPCVLQDFFPFGAAAQKGIATNGHQKVGHGEEETRQVRQSNAGHRDGHRDGHCDGHRDGHCEVWQHVTAEANNSALISLCA